MGIIRQLTVLTSPPSPIKARPPVQNASFTKTTVLNTRHLMQSIHSYQFFFYQLIMFPGVQRIEPAASHGAAVKRIPSKRDSR